MQVAVWHARCFCDAAMDQREQRQVTLGLGSYRARRVGDKIVLQVAGDTPTPNYKTWLRHTKPGGAAAEIADYELWWMPPADASIDLPTPFTAHISSRADPDVSRVRVRDAAGIHDVDVEGTTDVVPASTTALVYLHVANQFDLDYRGKHISFTRANVAGDPLMNYGDRYFYGEQILLQDTALGELVTATLERRPAGERWRLTLVLPKTWVSGYESATVDVLVIETAAHGFDEGPPPGQEIEYERVTQVGGHASFVVS